MGNLGVPELLFIFVIALLVFGPKRLPELGRSLGKGLSEFKKATNGIKDQIEREIQNAEVESAVEAARPKPTAPTDTQVNAPKS
jgi:TatA/E family protein of Tat protein translocase